jgi:hypothetical protein
VKKFLLLLLLFSHRLHAITYLSTGLSTGEAAILSDPRALSFPGSNSAPQIAVAQNGNAVALWTNFPNQIEIQGAFFNAKPPFPVSPPPNTWDTRWTALIVDPALIRSNNTGIIFDNTENFFNITGLIPPTIAIGSSPKIAVDKTGNAMVVYVTLTNQIVALYFHQDPFVNNRLVLINATILNNLGTSNISPAIAMNSEGVAIAVWIQNIPFQVLAATFSPPPAGLPPLTEPGVWSLPEIFMPTTQQPTGTYPNLGLGFNGNTNPPPQSPNIGTAVWLDGPTGTILTDSFTIPTTIP